MTINPAVFYIPRVEHSLSLQAVFQKKGIRSCDHNCEVFFRMQLAWLGLIACAILPEAATAQSPQGSFTSVDTLVNLNSASDYQPGDSCGAAASASCSVPGGFANSPVLFFLRIDNYPDYTPPALSATGSITVGAGGSGNLTQALNWSVPTMNYPVQYYVIYSLTAYDSTGMIYYLDYDVRYMSTD